LSKYFNYLIAGLNGTNRETIGVKETRRQKGKLDFLNYI